MTSPSQPPVQAAAAASRHSPMRALVVWLVGVMIVSAVVAVPYAVATSLRLDRETVQLRDAIAGSDSAAPAGWSRCVEVRMGSLSFALARMVARISDAPDEVRQAIGAARSAAVGVYQWHGADVQATRQAITGGSGSLRLGSRMWTRIVSVRSEGGESVAVFMPAASDDIAGNIELRVVVLADEQLVVVSAELDPESIAALVRPHLHEISCGMPCARHAARTSL